MILQKWIGKYISGFLELLLWVIPILCAIFGHIIGKNIFGQNNPGFVMLGIFAGLIMDIVLFGPLIILLEIRKSLKNK